MEVNGSEWDVLTAAVRVMMSEVNVNKMSHNE